MAVLGDLLHFLIDELHFLEAQPEGFERLVDRLLLLEKRRMARHMFSCAAGRFCS